MSDNEPPLGPGNTTSSALRPSSCTTCNTESAASLRGTSCCSDAFIRPAGTVQSLAARSTSPQVIPRTSPDLAAVKIANSRALAATPSRLRSWDMNVGISPYGRAAWCLTVAFLRGLRNTSKWPFSLAGFSPLRSPFAFAASRTFSIRPRTLEAVSGFFRQMGCTHRRTSSVST